MQLDEEITGITAILNYLCSKEVRALIEKDCPSGATQE